jgi:spore cortex biosynthesis protein YabQ
VTTAPPPGFVALSAGRTVAASLVGMAFGLWLEMYRGHLRAARPKGVALFVRDLLFWLGATVLTAFGLYLANWLDLRLYAVVAVALGALWTSWLVGGPVRAVASVATRAFAAVGRVVAWPLRPLAYFVTWPVRRVATTVKGRGGHPPPRPRRRVRRRRPAA